MFLFFFFKQHSPLLVRLTLLAWKINMPGISLTIEVQMSRQLHPDFLDRLTCLLLRGIQFRHRRSAIWATHWAILISFHIMFRLNLLNLLNFFLFIIFGWFHRLLGWNYFIVKLPLINRSTIHIMNSWKAIWFYSNVVFIMVLNKDNSYVVILVLQKFYSLYDL